MFPKPQDFPAAPAKLTRNSSVSKMIPFQLRTPVASVHSRRSAVDRTFVPKTAVDEYRHSIVHKNEVWFAREVRMSSPSSNGKTTENFEQSELGRGVSSSTDRGHHFVTGVRTEFPAPSRVSCCRPISCARPRLKGVARDRVFGHTTL